MNETATNTTRSRLRESAKTGDGARKIPILVIDDDPIAVRLMTRILEAAGHREVLGSTDSRRALQLFRKFRPGIVVLDINMPHLDGWEILERLTEPNHDSRECAAEPEIPLQVAIISADIDADSRRRAVALGARDVILKPIEPVDFAVRIRNLAELADALRMAARPEAARPEADRPDGHDDATRRALGEAEALLAARTEQLAAVGHELRTPLNAVLGFSELIRDEAHGPVGDARYADHAKEIHFAARHMLGLINNILDMSKAGAGKLSLNVTEVNVGDLIRSSVNLMRDLAAREAVSLDVEIPPNLPLLRTDPEKVQQILINLVSNAIKFTPPGGRVRVKAEYSPAEGMFIMVVSDTGIGMTPDEAKAAMEPYGQAAHERNRRHKGTGLGLPLTRKLVERLGGELTLDTRPGIGTTVTVRFPAEAVVLPADPPAPGSVPAGRPD